MAVGSDAVPSSSSLPPPQAASAMARAVVATTAAPRRRRRDVVLMASPLLPLEEGKDPRMGEDWLEDCTPVQIPQDPDVPEHGPLGTFSELAFKSSRHSGTVSRPARRRCEEHHGERT